MEYWRIVYRGAKGWKTRFYIGSRGQLDARIKTLKYDKIEVTKLNETEIDWFTNAMNVKFQKLAKER